MLTYLDIFQAVNKYDDEKGIVRRTIKAEPEVINKLRRYSQPNNVPLSIDDLFSVINILLWTPIKLETLSAEATKKLQFTLGLGLVRACVLLMRKDLWNKDNLARLVVAHEKDLREYGEGALVPAYNNRSEWLAKAMIFFHEKDLLDDDIHGWLSHSSNPENTRMLLWKLIKNKWFQRETISVALSFQPLDHNVILKAFSDLNSQQILDTNHLSALQHASEEPGMSNRNFPDNAKLLIELHQAKLTLDTTEMLVAALQNKNRESLRTALNNLKNLKRALSNDELFLLLQSHNPTEYVLALLALMKNPELDTAENRGLIKNQTDIAETCLIAFSHLNKLGLAMYCDSARDGTFANLVNIFAKHDLLNEENLLFVKQNREIAFNLKVALTRHRLGMFATLESGQSDSIVINDKKFTEIVLNELKKRNDPSDRKAFVSELAKGLLPSIDSSRNDDDPFKECWQEEKTGKPFNYKAHLEMEQRKWPQAAKQGLFPPAAAGEAPAPTEERNAQSSPKRGQ